MTTQTATTTKTVYLIRHAESDENRRIAALCRLGKTLGKFSLPTSNDVKASTELLNVQAQVDSDVSPIGKQQIDHMATKIQTSNFIVESGIQLVAHSPLIRAKQTCEGMLGCYGNSTTTSSTSSNTGGESDSSNANNDTSTPQPQTFRKHEAVNRVVETELLLEKTPAEWTPMYKSTFIKRIQQLEQWIGQQPESTIALVGHSQFFKAMLQLDFKFGNCEVWKVDFNSTTTDSTSTAAITNNNINDNDDNGKESSNTSQPNSPPSRQDSTDSGCQLPPQWSNLQQIFACEVESSKKTI